MRPLGALRARYDLYDAFGTPREQTSDSTLKNDRAFTGQQHDAESGHYYLRARYYDPQAGRFLSPDPIGLGGGSNLYAYAGNSPANYADPPQRFAPRYSDLPSRPPPRRAMLC